MLFFFNTALSMWTRRLQIILHAVTVHSVGLQETRRLKQKPLSKRQSAVNSCLIFCNFSFPLAVQPTLHKRDFPFCNCSDDLQSRKLLSVVLRLCQSQCFFWKLLVLTDAKFMFYLQLIHYKKDKRSLFE